MKCPHCFRRLPVSVEKLSCVGECRKETPGELVAINGGIDVPVKPMFDVSQGSCPTCRCPSSVEACPTCRGAVPPNWRQQPAPAVTCVAMAGARTSGKSIYLGVLVRQLELFVEERLGSVLNPLGDTEQSYQERFGDAIFGQRQILPATIEAAQNPASGEPLIYEFKTEDGRSHILVLRDVAGEDLEDLKNRKRRLTFLTRADAVVLLLDPLTISEIRGVLQGTIQMGELGGDGVEVLRGLLDFMRETEDRPKASTPIAVTLSKFDTLQALRDTNSPLTPLMTRPGSPLQRDPSMRTKNYDATDSALLQLEIDSLLQSLMGQKLRNVLRQSADVFHYFVVSTLGADPEGDALNEVGIAPYRVLDPMKWILKL